MKPQRLCLDTGFFCALERGSPTYPVNEVEAIKEIFSEIDGKRKIAFVSTLIFAELLDGSFERMRQCFDSNRGYLVEVNEDIASLARTVRYKVVRDKKHLEVPDCVYIATAIRHECDFLLTLDGLCPDGKVNPKFRILSAAELIEKQFGLRVCKPSDIVLQGSLFAG